MFPFSKSTYVTLAAAAALAAGCATEVEGPEAEADVLVGDPDQPIDSKMDTTGWTVGDAVTRVCSTAVVADLAEQLVAELECMQPNLIDRIDELAGVELQAGIRPYLQTGAADALAAAGAQRTIAITSGLRTLPQQYLLYQWYRRGLCRGVVSLAARPGRSNHESGLAIDVGNYGTVRTTLRNRGFKWFGSGDPVHFDFPAGTDLRTHAVRAFQRLHNLNSEEPISVDGSYGPQTERALREAPAGGFAIGSTCEGTSKVAVEVGWTPLGDGLVALEAVTPPGAAELELWIGGEQVAVLEAGAQGEVHATVATVGAAGPQLVEAVALDADGRVLGRGLDYLELPELAAAEAAAAAAARLE